MIARFAPDRAAPHPPRRRALVSVAMLVGLLVVGIVAASLIRVVVARRAALRLDERRAQAGLLADSGIARGLARLAASPTYRGETWTIPAADLDGRHAARVTIGLEPAAETPGTRRLVVVAEYPVGSPLLVRQSRFVPIPVPATADPIAR